nr:MAG TPA: hypothetical protein [Bacteriophage sp.]DAQ41421.1 MAG TPA: hypothetical protein [Caudoviricetes sp.]
MFTMRKRLDCSSLLLVTKNLYAVRIHISVQLDLQFILYIMYYMLSR